MKRSLLIIPAAAVVGAAMAFASLKAKKLRNAAQKEEKTENAKPTAAENLQQGSYSFVSGFKETAELKVTLNYNPDKFFFDILDSDFPVYTSDSHVAFLSGEDFAFQLEYASYYGDEGFEGLCAREREKHPAAESISLAGTESLKFIEGDNIVFTVPADSFSCIVINVIKDKGNDETLEELASEPALLNILNSIKIEKE